MAFKYIHLLVSSDYIDCVSSERIFTKKEKKKKRQKEISPALHHSSQESWAALQALPPLRCAPPAPGCQDRAHGAFVGREKGIFVLILPPERLPGRRMQGLCKPPVRLAGLRLTNREGWHHCLEVGKMSLGELDLHSQQVPTLARFLST